MWIQNCFTLIVIVKEFFDFILFFLLLLKSADNVHKSTKHYQACKEFTVLYRKFDIEPYSGSNFSHYGTHEAYNHDMM